MSLEEDRKKRDDDLKALEEEVKSIQSELKTLNNAIKSGDRAKMYDILNSLISRSGVGLKIWKDNFQDIKKSVEEKESKCGEGKSVNKSMICIPNQKIIM